MAKQIINIGTVPNDGTGDSPRVAMDKCNDNFDELYADKLDKATVPVALMVECGDETTALTVGDGKRTLRMPHAMTLTSVRASVTTAPTGAALLLDIRESGSTILSTALSIDASEKTSVTAATPAVISDSALADDAEISVDVDQIGSSVAGAGLKVWLIGTRAV
jgi:hypothetical protein